MTQPPRGPGDDFFGGNNDDDNDDGPWRGGPGEPDPPEVERTRKIRNVVIAILAIIGVIVIAVAMVGNRGPSPKAFIEANYTRTSALDEPSVNAYTSDKDPQAVASEISGAAEPIDRRSSSANSAQNGGDAVFLQYSDDIVALFPYNDGGTKVMVSTNYRRAHSHYFVYVGGWWPSSPQSAGGSGYRGGGSGSGK